MGVRSGGETLEQHRRPAECRDRDLRLPHRGGWNAVYVSATASEVTGADLEQGIELYHRRSVERGLREWTADDVRAPAKHRLFRAAASECFVLSPHDERIPVRL
jgi:hypothetical protein